MGEPRHQLCMSPGLAIFILVVILVVGWFAAGTHYNVRKGDHVMRWLHEGLPLIGEKTNLQWLGSSVLQLKIQQAKSPFRHAEIVLVLEPRDVAPLWGLAHLGGRRDLFIFRGALREQPRLQLEALDPASWSTRGLMELLKQRHWTPLSAPCPLVAYADGSVRAASETLNSARLDNCPLQLLAVRHAEPNIEVQWHLDPLRKHSSRYVFETLRVIAQHL